MIFFPNLLDTLFKDVII